MKKLFTYLFSLAILAGILTKNANAQITVTGSTGADANYTSLTNSDGAFNAINATVQTGNNIVITITASSTLEDGATSLMAGEWTSLKIYPTVSGLEVSGNVAAKPMIDLSGADKVIIDGRVNESGGTDLIISNTSLVNNAGTSTIRLINDASSNTIQYCNLKGSSTATACGVLFFSTGSATGNINNLIANNNITCSADANRPVNVIYSSGSNLRENRDITISNNNFYDFFNREISSYGINLAAYSSSWTITGNSFYETDSFKPAANAAYNVIYLNYVPNDINITGNYIGGSSPACGNLGTVPSWTKTDEFTNSFTAINVTVINSSSVQGNVIKNFSWANAGAANWIAIAAGYGNVNIGSSSGNTIGEETGSGSITLTSGASGAFFYGISIGSSGIITVENNTIGSVTAANNDANSATNFCGILCSGTTSNNIINNQIGSLTTENSIWASSASMANAQSVYGIYGLGSGGAAISGNKIANLTNSTANANAATAGVTDGMLITGGSNSISYNKVWNLINSNNNTTSLYQASVGGIVINSLSGSQSLIGNSISELSNTYPFFAGSIVGLYFNGSTLPGKVSGNLINSLAATGGATTAANIYGIKINAGAATYSNNIIALDDNSASTLFGIYETGNLSNNNNLYFNTVYIGGSPVAGSFPSYALFSASTANVRNFRNNILSNFRSNSGASGSNYAVSLATNSGLTIDYNDYYAPGSGGVIGWLESNATTLADWQTLTLSDASSLNTDPVFALAGGLLPANYVISASLPATTGTGILSDYNESIRNSSPKMGAIESATASNLVDIYSGGFWQASYTNLRIAFSQINKGTHTGDLEVRLTGTQYLAVGAILNESGSGSASYSSVKIYPTSDGLSILSDISASPMIDLNGADKVTIDGRVNASGTSKSLTIENTSTSSATGTSTIRLINDATLNTIQYCIIKGAETSITSGILFFSGTAGPLGNEENLIENNDITSSGSDSRPACAIYSAGQATAGLENSENTISKNNIYDFLNGSISSYGIFLFTGNDDWTISENSFYETTSFSPTSFSQFNIIAVKVSGTFNISGNFIGGSAPNCAGMWTKTNSNNNAFYAISYVPTTVTTPAFNIQGNTVQNFNWSNSTNASWYGFYVGNGFGGTVNIGNTAGNVIGSETGNNSITLRNGSTGGTFYGISFWQNASLSYYLDVANIENNVIGAISLENASSLYATNFYGIFRNCNTRSGRIETYNILNNTIGSTDSGTSNSINASSNALGAIQLVYGISTYGRPAQTYNINGNKISKLTNGTTNATAATGLVHGISPFGPSLAKYTINNNTINDLTIANSNSNSSTSASIVGIALTSSMSPHSISGNTIYNLSNTSAASGSSIFGIYFSGGTLSSDVSGNFIHSFSSNPANTLTPAFYGIRGAGGVATYSNNIISLSTDLPATIYGMYITPGTSAHNLYFNTVNIGGTAPSGVANSYAFGGIGTGSRNFKNNIFVNNRSNTGATGINYAAAFFSTTGAIVCDYNNYVASGAGGVLGAFAGDKLTLPIVTGQDVNSKSVDPLFTTPGGASAIDYYPSELSLTGVSGTGIETDYLGNSRVAIKMGAIEDGTCTNPTDGGTIAEDQSSCGSFDPAPIASLTSPSGYFLTLEYKWQSSTDNSTFSDISGEILSSYDPGTVTQTTWYKRLAKVSCEADWTGAAESNVVKMTIDEEPTLADAGNDQAKCDLGEFDLVGNPAILGTGTWSVVSGTAVITDPLSPVTTATGIPAGTTAELSWTISNGSCAASSDLVLLTNDLLPTTADAGTDQTQCNSGEFILNASKPLVGTGKWAVVNGFAVIADPTSETSEVSGLQTGKTVELSWTITNGTCSSTDRVKLTNNTNPPAPRNDGDKYICAGESMAKLTASPGAGETVDWYSLPTGGIALASGSILYSPTAPGSFYAEARNLTTGCVSDSRTKISLSETPYPSVFIVTGGGAYCAGESGVSIILSGSERGVNYQLYNSNLEPVGSALAGTGSALTFGNITGNGTYQVVGSNAASACNISMNSNVIVTENQLTVPVISGPIVACEGSTALNYSTETGMSNYSWTVSSGGTIAEGTETDHVLVNWESAGSQTISVSYTNAKGCTGTSTLNITVNPLPTATLTGSGIVCAGSTGHLSVALTGTAPWSIEYSDGTSTMVVNDVVTSPYSLEISPLENTTNTYFITAVSDLNGCTNTGMGSVDVIVPPVLEAPVATESADLCYGSEAAVLRATATIDLTGTIAYIWQTSTDNAVWQNITGANELTYAPGVLNSSRYYRLSASAGDCGSVNSNAIKITVLDPLTNPQISSESPTVCYDSAPALLTSAGSTGGNGSFTYQWQMKTTGNWSDVGTNGLTFQPGNLTATTSYQLIATDNSASSCGWVTSNELVILVNEQTMPGTIAADQRITAGEVPSPLISLAEGSGGGTISYSWEASSDEGLSWTIISNETGAGYAPGALTDPTWFRRITRSDENSLVCSATSAPVKITISPTAITNPESLNELLTAFAVRNIEIRVKGEVSSMAVATLYDISGKTIWVKKLQEGHLNIIPTPYIKQGIYVLLVTDNEKTGRFKIPVNE